MAKKSIISFWDVDTGKEVRQLTYDSEGYFVTSMAFSADGRMLASRAPHNVWVWEVATGKKIHRLKVKDGRSFSPLTYSPDSKTLIIGRAGHLLDVGTGKEICSFGCAGAMEACFSPDGKVLAIADAGGAIRLWETATGKEIGLCKGFRGSIRSIAYSPDGKTLASVDGDGAEIVHLWEAATGKKSRQLAKHTIGGVLSIAAYSPDGKMFLSLGDNVIYLWETSTGKEIRRFTKESMVLLSATFSPDGKKLAASASNRIDEESIYVWEVATGKEIYRLKTEIQSPPPSSWSVVFSPDGRLLAAPGKENTVSLWEVATGQRVGQLVGPKRVGREDLLFVQSLAFSPDGRVLATSSRWDDKIRLWEAASGKEIRQLDGLKNCPEGSTLAFSPDGRILATAPQGTSNNNGSRDLKVHLWEVTTGKEIGRLIGHQAIIQTLAFSPDGKTLASGSDDLTCLIWDVTPFMSRLTPTPPPPLASQTLSQEQLETAWADLVKDPAKAYAAVQVLQAVPAQAIPLLQARIQPVTPLANPRQLQRWIADLDDNHFTVRDKAQREIEKLGEVAIPALRQALKDRPMLEMKRRLQGLLAELEPKVVAVSPRYLRELRAVQVLESIGTAEAQQLLQAWAKGVAEASLTRDAQAALARLAKRSTAKP